MYKIYVVEEGDTLISIAAKFNTTTEILNTINGKIPKIEKGTEIIVPNVTEIPFAIYKVKKGDSLYDIARRNDINYKDIILLNGLKEGEYIYPDQELLIPKANIGIYMITGTKTLNQISNELMVPVIDIVDQNASIYLLPDQVIIYKKEKTI